VRPMVVRGLVPALDDPKRAVRRRAVACRNEWYVQYSRRVSFSWINRTA
jgi:hypothetical protein